MELSSASARPTGEASFANLLELAAAGVPVVTAGRRLARTLLAEFAARARQNGPTAWRTPLILPWSAWIEKLWDAALFRGLPLPARLDPDQELLTWERLIEVSAGPDTLLDLPAAAEAASSSWQLLCSWRLDLESFPSDGSEDVLAFLDWARLFLQRSQAENWLEFARWSDRLIPVLDRLALPARIILAGFDEITPQQQAFLDACGRLGVQCHLAGAPSRLATERFRIAVPDPNQELHIAALWARALLERGQARTIAVIVPNLESRRTEVERAFLRVLDPARLLPGPSSPSPAFNLAAPPPLIAQPLVRSALLALQLDPEQNSTDLVGRLLRSSFFMDADSERPLRARLDALLRDRSIARISVARLRALCRSLTPPCKRFRLALRRWLYRRQQLPELQSPSSWARAFALLLRALGWPGERPLSSDEFQTLEAWNESLARLARLDRVAARFTYREALAQLERILARTPFQPQGLHAPIQILGLWEAAGLEFDALWICGLDEESWPPPPSPDPFLPLSLQRAHNLPHSSPERELDLARRLTHRLLSSAPLVIASWPLRVEDQDRAPSPLIRDWPEISRDQLPHSACPGFVQLLAETSAAETRCELHAPPVQADVWSRGGSRVFQYQALCPFRAFAQLRLGAAPLRSPEPGLQPLDRGHAVHAALEYFWKHTRTQARLLGLGPQELDELLDQAIETALAPIRSRRPDLQTRLLDLERLRLKELLAAWLELEKQRPEPFEVVALEEPRDIELAGVRATIKVDRVDRLPDGRHIILDYKTGDCSPNRWEGDRPEDPQLPLYAVTHDRLLAGLFYAQIKADRICFKPDPRKSEPLSGKRLRDWRCVLEQLAQSFRSGYAAVDPKRADQTCRNCGLDPLCRVHEALLQSEDEEETA